MAIVIDGNNTPTAGGVGYGDGTELAFTAAGTSGQPIVSGGASAPAFRPYTLPAADGSASQVLQTNGSGALSFATIASGLSAATQAQMEAASSNTVAVTPLSTNWHPGVAKAWLRCGTTGNILASHNITSVTDSGVGEVNVTIATDFSSDNYVVVMSVTVGGPRYIFTSSVQAGSFNALAMNSTLSQADPDSWHFSCFGDQA